MNNLFSDPAPISLSSQALNIRKEVESLWGASVLWNERRSINGEACVIPGKPIPIVFYKSRDSLSEETCVHELFHLKLEKLGFPYCEKVNPKEDNAQQDGTVIMLNGIFEHAVFFPDLVKLGYDPYTAEELGTKKQIIEALKPDFQKKPLDHSFLQSQMALLYARSSLDCKTEEVRKLRDRLFEYDKYTSSKEIGEKIISLVSDYAVNNIERFRTGLEKSIDTLKETHFIRVSTNTLNRQ